MTEQYPNTADPADEAILQITAKMQQGPGRPSEEQVQDRLEDLGLVITNYKRGGQSKTEDAITGEQIQTITECMKATEMHRQVLTDLPIRKMPKKQREAIDDILQGMDITIDKLSRLARRTRGTAGKEAANALDYRR